MIFYSFLNADFIMWVNGVNVDACFFKLILLTNYYKMAKQTSFKIINRFFKKQIQKNTMNNEYKQVKN